MTSHKRAPIIASFSEVHCRFWFLRFGILVVVFITRNWEIIRLTSDHADLYDPFQLTHNKLTRSNFRRCRFWALRRQQHVKDTFYGRDLLSRKSEGVHGEYLSHIWSNLWPDRYQLLSILKPRYKISLLSISTPQTRPALEPLRRNAKKRLSLLTQDDLGLWEGGLILGLKSRCEEKKITESKTKRSEWIKSALGDIVAFRSKVS